MKAIKQNIKKLFVIIFLFTAYSKNDAISYEYIINKTIIENNNEVVTAVLNKRNSKPIKKEFILSENKVFEVHRFYDYDGKLSDSLTLNLSELPILKTVNLKDSITNYSGLPHSFYWEYKIGKSSLGDLIITKTGLGNNLNIEKFIFNKNNELVGIYF